MDVVCDSRMSGGSRGLRLWLPSDRINGCLPTKNYVGRLFQAALNGPGISLTLGVSSGTGKALLKNNEVTTFRSGWGPGGRVRRWRESPSWRPISFKNGSVFQIWGNSCRQDLNNSGTCYCAFLAPPS